MDEKELKKLLDKELDKLAPSMSKKVKNAPIITVSEKAEKSAHRIDIKPVPKHSGSKKFAIGAIAAVLVVAIALAVILPPMLGGGDPDATYSAGYLRMDINPSVEFVFDGDGKVTAVKSANSDADVLLTGELRNSVKGMNVDEAAATVAEEAGKLGYIVPETENAVRITVVVNGAKADEVIGKTTAAIENRFMQRGVLVAVVSVKRSADWLAEQYGAAATDLKSAVESVASKADEYFEQLAKENQSSLDKLKEYYEKEVFGYLTDLLKAECAKITVTREYLHKAQTLNDEIKSYNFAQSFLKKDYWETVKTDEWKEDESLAELVEDMSSLLERIGKIRDDEIDGYAELLALTTLYDLFIDEEWIYDIGNATLEEIKGSLDYIVQELEKLNVTITDGIRDAFAKVPSSVGEFLDGTQSAIDGMREELEEIYLEYFEQDREYLTREDYDSFYTRIESEYGSLEAYWEARESA